MYILLSQLIHVVLSSVSGFQVNFLAFIMGSRMWRGRFACYTLPAADSQLHICKPDSSILYPRLHTLVPRPNQIFVDKVGTVTHMAPEVLRRKSSRRWLPPFIMSWDNCVWWKQVTSTSLYERVWLRALLGWMSLVLHLVATFRCCFSSAPRGTSGYTLPA